MDFISNNGFSIITALLAIGAFVVNFLLKKKNEAEQKAENVELQVAQGKLEERTDNLKEQLASKEETLKHIKEPTAQDLSPKEAENYWNGKKN